MSITIISGPVKKGVTIRTQINVNGKLFHLHHQIDVMDASITSTIYNDKDGEKNDMVWKLVMENEQHLEKAKSITSYDEYVAFAADVKFSPLGEDIYSSFLSIGITSPEILQIVEQTISADDWKQVKEFQENGLSHDEVEEEYNQNAKKGTENKK